MHCLSWMNLPLPRISPFPGRGNVEPSFSLGEQRWQRNNNSRHHSSLMPISSFPPAPPTRGWLCQPLCLGCQGQRPARCNTRSRTPSGKKILHRWGEKAQAHFCCK
uniref:Uncharacterized protein n=1 Tax=Equus caballus TaxID=9796 RepID=A0A9L0SDC7_HORSE